MSKLTRWTIGFVLPLCVVAVAMTSARIAEATQPNSSLHTYRDVDGKTFFALSLQPTMEQPTARMKRDILLLVDTSASQTGLFRADALEAVDTIAAGLQDGERLNVMAIDLKAVPMTAGFVEPTNKLLKQGIMRLKRRTPLGATDLVSGLKTAVAQFKDSGDRVRSIIYIGDGMSRANAPALDEVEPLTQQLIDQRISVNSYAVGLRTDLNMLAVVANNTGGSVFVDGPAVTAQQAGAATLGLARGTVVWPAKMEWPSAITQAYPARVPPLRFDRDTILIGTLVGKDTLNVTLHGEVAGKMQAMKYSLQPNDTSKISAYTMVPELVAAARKTDGIMMPILGTHGLDNARNLFLASSNRLSLLGQQALSRGDKDGGVELLREALRRDPANSRAIALLKSNTSVRATSTKGIVAYGPQEDDPFGELDDLGGGGDDPFGGDGGGDDPFGGGDPVVEPEPEPAPEPAPLPADDGVFGEPEPAPAIVEPSPAEVLPENPTQVPEELIGAPIPSNAPPVPTNDGFYTPAPALGEPMLLLGQEADSDRDLLLNAEEEARLNAEIIKAEVVRALSDDGSMRNNPAAALEVLKNLAETIKQAPDLPNEIRSNLLGRLEVGLRTASRNRLAKDRADELARANQASLENRRRIYAASQRKNQKVQQYIDQTIALLDEGKYELAEEVALELRDIAPRRVEPQIAVLNASWVGNYKRIRALHEYSARMFTESLYNVEVSHVPTPDDPPIVYPDAEEWARLSERRKAIVDLGETSPTARLITAELDEKITLNVEDEILSDVMDQIKTDHGIEIQFDRPALNEESIEPTSETVSINVSNVSLKTALDLMLADISLTYVIKDEYLMITTKDKADETLITKVYPVGDLVMPISSMGGMMGGMMGGGMMGGMGGGMGGMGGGMGGMGGGMGGMGGGMGGMGGGMGGMGGGMMGGMGGGMGGMMDVDDAISLKPKAKPVAKATAKPATQQPSVQAKSNIVAKRIVLADKAGQSLDAKWNRYFAKLWQMDLTSAQERQMFANVRQTVRDLNKEQNFNEVSSLIQAALRNGQFQPWMHQLLGMAMRATNADRSEIERAFMSTVDLSQNADQVVLVAIELSRNGFDERAMQLYRDIATAYPLNPAPYMHGLDSATRLKDQDGIRWACEHILAQAWPDNQKFVFEKAVTVAKATLYDLEKAGKTKEANELASVLNEALSRDCIVRVTWTGDADVDLLVEEPAGTVCSSQNKRTTSGGVMLGDALPDPDNQTVDGITETYMCPRGFDGEYHVLLRKIFGDVAGNKVTVEIVTNMKTKVDGTTVKQSIKKQIDLSEKDAMLTFKLEDGRREEPLEDHIAETAAVRHIETNRALLAQQFDALADERVESANSLAELELLRTRDPRQAARLQSALRGRGAVGFMPVIQQFPEGTMMMGQAVISADRRYVRVSMSPFFSRIADVQTFNFATGAGQQQAGGLGGGGGGGAGGFGGGGFGGAGGVGGGGGGFQ